MGSTSTSIGVSSTVTATSDGSTDSDATTTGFADTGPAESSEVGTTTAVLDETTAGGSETGDSLPCDAMIETFAADPGWTAVALPHEGNAFGWVGTAIAGGNAGEIGGTLQRSNTALTYADTTVAIAAGDCVTATGVLAATMRDDNFNTGLGFGHFSTSTGMLIGFRLAEANGGMLRVSVHAGAFEEQLALMDAVGVPRVWSYAYDPVAGTMSLSIDGVGGVTRPVDAATVAGMEQIDAFGLSLPSSDNAGAYPGLLGLYLDEIAYTR